MFFWTRAVPPPLSSYLAASQCRPDFLSCSLSLSSLPRKACATRSVDSLEYFFSADQSVSFHSLTRETGAASIMFSTRTLVALAVAFSPLALAATLISDVTMTNYLDAGGLELAYANSPFVTPTLMHRLVLLPVKLAHDGICPLESGFLVKL